MEKIKMAEHFFSNINISHKWLHYLHIYEDIFKDINPQKILEIGMDNGGFLETLHAIFPNADILGLDINENCKNIKFNTDKIKTLVIPEEKIKPESHLWSNYITDTFDIIIDDASHQPSAQFKNYYDLFEKLNNNGIYIIEDIECSYFKKRKYYSDLKNNILKLVDDLNGWYQQDIHANCKPNIYTKNYYKIEFYSGMIVIYKKQFLHEKPLAIGSGKNAPVRFPEYLKRYISKEYRIDINQTDQKLLKNLSEISLNLYKNFTKH